MHWIRRIRLGSATVALSAVAMVSLSDKAPGMLKALMLMALGLFGPFQAAPGQARSMIDSPFATDTIGHFIMWATIGLLAAGIARTNVDRFTVFTALFAISALFEAGQQYLSWSRSASFSDLAANGVGLAFGYLAYIATERFAISRGYLALDG